MNKALVGKTNGQNVEIALDKSQVQLVKIMEDTISEVSNTKEVLQHFAIQNGYLVATNGQVLTRLKIQLDTKVDESLVYKYEVKDSTLFLTPSKHSFQFPQVERVIPTTHLLDISLDKQALVKIFKDFKQYFKKFKILVVEVKNNKVYFYDKVIGYTTTTNYFTVLFRQSQLKSFLDFSLEDDNPTMYIDDGKIEDNFYQGTIYKSCDYGDFTNVTYTKSTYEESNISNPHDYMETYLKDKETKEKEDRDRCIGSVYVDYFDWKELAEATKQYFAECSLANAKSLYRDINVILSNIEFISRQFPNTKLCLHETYGIAVIKDDDIYKEHESKFDQDGLACLVRVPKAKIKALRSLASYLDKNNIIKLVK